MSKSLSWSIIPQEPKQNGINNLKYIMGNKIFGENWNNGDYAEEGVGEELIAFLEGIAAAGQKEVAEDANSLIAAIRKHGKVKIENS